MTDTADGGVEHDGDNCTSGKEQKFTCDFCDRVVTILSEYEGGNTHPLCYNDHAPYDMDPVEGVDGTDD